MNYRYKASQTIYKMVEIEATNEDDADEIVQKMLEEGVIRFDDEPWLDMETNIRRI